MKGIVFNLLESFVSSRFSEEKWDQIHEETNLKNKDPFIGPGTYEDEDLLALVATSNRLLDMSVPKILFAFGRFCFKPMVETRPQYLEGIDSSKDLLKIIDQVIHVEVKKLMPNAYLPKIEISDSPDGKLIVVYESKRSLCGFLEGMVTGCAEYFDEHIEINHPVCTHNGDSHCELSLDITKKIRRI